MDSEKASYLTEHGCLNCEKLSLALSAFACVSILKGV